MRVRWIQVIIPPSRGHKTRYATILFFRVRAETDGTLYQWYKFDDDKVTSASLGDVLSSRSKAYMCFYIRKQLDYGSGASNSASRSASNMNVSIVCLLQMHFRNEHVRRTGIRIDSGLFKQNTGKHAIGHAKQICHSTSSSSASLFNAELHSYRAAKIRASRKCGITSQTEFLKAAAR